MARRVGIKGALLATMSVPIRVLLPGVGLCAIAVTACVDNDPIGDYLRDLPYFPADPVQPKTQVGDASEANEGEYLCTTERFSETGQFDKIVAYAANSESLWPGAIVGGDSVVSGLFRQEVMPRAPLTISVGLESLGGSRSATMQSPSLSSSREAVSSILSSSIDGATPAMIDFQMEQVYSKEQLSLALDASVAWGTGEVDAGFDFNKQDVKSRYLVKYVQSYYTIDVDEPVSGGDFFSSAVGLDDVKDRFNDTNIPLYVSSITYGRMVIFTLESNQSSEEIGAALSAAFSAGVTDVDIEMSFEHKQLLETSTIHAVVIGGNGDHAAKAVYGIEGIKSFIQEGGNYSKESPGAPIAYKLKHLGDNSPARMSLTTEYDAKTCVRVSSTYAVRLKQFKVVDGGDEDDLDIYGTCWVEAGGQRKNIWSKGSGSWVRITEGYFFPSGSNANLGEVIVTVAPEIGERIRFGCDLGEHDGFMNADEHFSGSRELPYGTSGWGGEQIVSIVGGKGYYVESTFVMEPIFQ